MPFDPITIVAIVAAPLAAGEKVPLVEAYFLIRKGEPGLLRRATPATRPDSWLTPADYPAEALAAGRSGYVEVTVTVGADDSVKGCRVTAGAEDAALRARACEIVRTRGTVRHALAQDGTPTTGELVVLFSWTMPESGHAVSPAPPAPPPPPSLDEWPVRSVRPGTVIADAPKWAKFRPVKNARGEVAIGVVLTPEAIPVDCIVLKSSGDAALDAATCAAARSATYRVQPQTAWARWSKTTLPMIVTWQNGKASHRLPVTTTGARARLATGTSLALDPALLATMPGKSAALELDIAPTGAVSDCRIGSSTGSDAGDFGLCRYIRTIAFQPATDVFGQPLPSTITQYFRLQP